jgi:GntR family transcriptional repressor for pyruvate dehydrogenase complex
MVAARRRVGKVGPATKLKRHLTERLAADIASGRLAPGARLPTEQALGERSGVSRTVVREAVAALRAQGLVVTRQGVGAFVASEAMRRPFRLDPDGLRSVAEVLDVMELRAGVEVVAAGLAAERASPAAVKRIGAAMNAIDRAIARGGQAVDEDFRFHREIAAATGNGQLVRFLDFLGRLVIPRHTIRLAGNGKGAQRAYLERVHREHRSVFEAIRARSPQAAREAMRQHLEKSRARYRQLADEIGR